MKRKIDKDNAILNAARRSFLHFGVAGARMDQIAKDAGVSKATLYKYYASKEAILQQLMLKMFNEMSEGLQYPYDETASIESMFQEVLTRKFALLDNDVFMELLRILSVEFIKQQDFAIETLKSISEGHNNFVQWVECCQRDGKLSSETSATEITGWFHALYDGMLLWPIIMNIIPAPSPIEQAHFRMVISSSFLKMFAT